MKKRIALALFGLVVMVAIIAGIKVLQIRRMIEHGKNFVPPTETVTTAEVHKDTWELTVPAVGSLEAVQGMDVTAELPGRVEKIAFESGARVEQGDLLVKFDTSSEEAQLRSAEAAADLAKINFDRVAQLVKTKTIARAEFDTTEAKLKEARAQCDIIRAVIAKKNVRAPFAGRLGIRLVNPGQILKEGQPIVNLQALDPILVNFLLPQQELMMVQTGSKIRVKANTLPDEVIEGIVSTINPEVEEATRNVRIQATVDNGEEKLRPGMYVNVSLIRPEHNEVLIIPATAVLYAPYSDSVFVVEEKKEEKNGGSGKVLRQQFVRLGEKRGDFVAVLSGISEGEVVVSTGVFKLRNGMAVKVDNTEEPEFQLNPQPADS